MSNARDAHATVTTVLLSQQERVFHFVERKQAPSRGLRMELCASLRSRLRTKTTPAFSPDYFCL